MDVTKQRVRKKSSRNDVCQKKQESAGLNYSSCSLPIFSKPSLEQHKSSKCTRFLSETVETGQHDHTIRLRTLTSSSFFAFPVTKTTDRPAAAAMMNDTRRVNEVGPNTSASITANKNGPESLSESPGSV